MQTCLEKIAIPKRNIDFNRNDYTSQEEYWDGVPDSRADGDPQGKGVGGGHGHWTPDCTKATLNEEGSVFTTMDYSNFTTEGAGGKYDIEGIPNIAHSGRERLLAINNFNKVTEYGLNYIDTTLNVREGQFQVPTQTSLRGRPEYNG